MSRRLAIVAAVGLTMALAGCKARGEEGAGAGAGAAIDPGPPAMPDPISAAEAQTGRDACTAYGAQACRCADQLEELRSDCEMSAARLEALDLNLRAAMAEGDATDEDRRVLVANARKIMRSCIEDASALVVRGCPLKDESGGEAPGAATPPATPPSPGSPEPAPPR
jgi:hypothetical protein